MRINSNNHIVYSHTPSMKPVAQSPKTVDTVSEEKSKPSSQQLHAPSEMLSPVEEELDYILSQAGVNQMRVSPIADADEVGFHSADTDGLVIGEKYVQYEKAESIYDIPYTELNSRFYEAGSEVSFLDTDNMTKAEIYDRVQAIFKEYLGEDFLEPSIVYSGGLGSLDLTEFPMNIYQRISNQYNLVLHRLGVTSVDGQCDYSAIIESKGFTGMTEAEMRAAVRSKYPENMTFKQTLLMAHDLEELGLETTAYGRSTVENIFLTLNLRALHTGEDPNTTASVLKAKKIFDTLLEMPADFDSMKESVESYRTPQGTFFFGHNSLLSTDDVLKELLSWFGGDALYGTDLADNLMSMLDGNKVIKNKILRK